MKDMHIWVRETYAVVEPWDTLDGRVNAHDKETGKLIGSWPEGGHFPSHIQDAYNSLRTISLFIPTAWRTPSKNS